MFYVFCAVAEYHMDFRKFFAGESYHHLPEHFVVMALVGGYLSYGEYLGALSQEEKTYAQKYFEFIGKPRTSHERSRSFVVNHVLIKLKDQNTFIIMASPCPDSCHEADRAIEFNCTYGHTLASEDVENRRIYHVLGESVLDRICDKWHSIEVPKINPNSEVHIVGGALGLALAMWGKPRKLRSVETSVHLLNGDYILKQPEWDAILQKKEAYYAPDHFNAIDIEFPEMPQLGLRDRNPEWLLRCHGYVKPKPQYKLIVTGTPWWNPYFDNLIKRPRFGFPLGIFPPIIGHMRYAARIR